MILEDLLEDHKKFIINMAIRLAMVYTDDQWVLVLRLLPQDLRHLTPNVFACNYISTVKLRAPMGKWTQSSTKRKGCIQEIYLEWHFNEKFHAAVTKYFYGNFDILYESENPAPFEGVNHRIGGLISDAPSFYSVLEISRNCELVLGDRERTFLEQLKSADY